MTRSLRRRRRREARGEEAELEALQSDVVLLNDRRRRLVRQFVDELRLAQTEEIRRREDHAA